VGRPFNACVRSLKEEALAAFTSGYVTFWPIRRLQNVFGCRGQTCWGIRLMLMMWFGLLSPIAAEKAKLMFFSGV